ncbi:ankyrin repeat-containing domain protein [Mycena rebaudengoi]|nr:ankyrin repeat-containing domain protein [Mycena rebaudengoi]
MPPPPGRPPLLQLTPELILLLPPSLSTASLNSLILTCRRQWKILQPDLEARLTPSLSRQILYWAAASKPHIVKKLLSPPHNKHPSAEYGYFNHTPLHVAADAGNVEIATLLLEAGANPNAEYNQQELRPLEQAVEKHDSAMAALLLDRGAQNATALGFAVRARQLELVRHLLAKGADATVVVPLYTLLYGPPAAPLSAELLYVAMQLRCPKLEIERQMFARRRKQVPLPAWTGVPLEDAQRGIMALLIAHWASKDATIARILKHLTALANAAERTEEDFLEACHAMIKEAEDAVPDVLGTDIRS